MPPSKRHERVKEEELSKTFDIYRRVAVAINSFPSGKSISVKDLSEKANVHWNTAKKALLFFAKIAPLVPKFEVMPDLQFQIKEKPYAIQAVEGIFESKEMRILTKFMLAEATELQKADRTKDILTVDEKSVLPSLIEKGYVNSINGNYYLSKRGQSLGSMGIRKIVDLNIPLPWEQTEIPMLEPNIPTRLLPRLQRYTFQPPEGPKSIYSPTSLDISEKSKWKCYIS